MPPMVSDPEDELDDDELDTIPARAVKPKVHSSPEAVDDEVLEDADEVPEDADEVLEDADDALDADDQASAAAGDDETAADGDEKAAAAEDEDDDEDGEEYVVEAIEDHAWMGGTLKLLVKWQGYDKPEDMTHETTSTLSGAKDAVKAYYSSIGGRPDKSMRDREDALVQRGLATAAAAKRGAKQGTKRKSSSSAATEDKQPNGKRAKKAAAGRLKLPEGSWEDEIHEISGIQQGSDDPAQTGTATLIAMVVLSDNKKIQITVDQARSKAPQKLIDFFLNHLSFREKEEETGGEAAKKK